MGFIREREAFGMAEIFVRKFDKESLPKSVEWDARIWDERGVMKKRPSRTLCAILSFAFILMMGAGRLCAQTATANTLQHPKDQIALQLGAIQMGYTVPFTLTGNISVQKMQQAVNALVMGRNALDATVAKPAVKVVEAVDSPSVDTVEYRDQLYAAVEYVVTSPVVATIKGNATLTGNKKVSVAATKLTLPPNAWTIPVPYAMESRSSADVQALRDELVAAGVLSGGGGNATADMVSVAGGTLPQSSELAGQTVAAFQIGKYEVTWGEWKTVRDWAVNNGYSDLAGVGDTYPSGSADNFPVINVSWYDVVKWSNARSEKEGMTPVYTVNGTTYKTGASIPTVNASANGYRLPSEKEWEWAARGGLSSGNFTYSGSNTVSEVAWTYENSSSGTKAVGTKAANELGIYDMSGNVWEWCEDVAYTSYRRLRGGSWINPDGNAAVAYRANNNPDNRHDYIGFRLARSSGN
jgi:formylglycine-generating enzyme required for sulfatase activity